MKKNSSVFITSSFLFLFLVYAPSAFTDNIVELLNEGISLKESGDFKNAEKKFEEVLKISPDFREAEILLYEMRLQNDPFKLFKDNQTDEVAWEAALMKSLSSDLEKVQPLLNAAPSSVSKNRIEEYKSLYKKVLSLRKNNAVSKKPAVLFKSYALLEFSGVTSEELGNIYEELRGEVFREKIFDYLNESAPNFTISELEYIDFEYEVIADSNFLKLTSFSDEPYASEMFANVVLEYTMKHINNKSESNHLDSLNNLNAYINDLKDAISQVDRRLLTLRRDRSEKNKDIVLLKQRKNLLLDNLAKAQKFYNDQYSFRKKKSGSVLLLEKPTSPEEFMDKSSLNDSESSP